jgi:2-amino-4-hydroxy-6-hydroxymethyldihydropteridine diphosphokinase
MRYFNQLVTMAEPVFLSLGSNVGDRSANLRAAIERLGDHGAVRAVSGFYETEPVGLHDQPWFLNCVLTLETDDAPEALLKKVLAIEQEMGRLRTRDKGPRSIDIDILLFGDRVVDGRELKIPHPAMHQRRFVLEPLAEIAPEALHPQLRKTARELLADLPPGRIVRRLKPQT